MPEPMGTLLVIGGGGHAWVVTESARAQGWRVLGFFDDDAQARLDDTAPRLGALSEAPGAQGRAEPGAGAENDAPPASIIALGSLDLRARLIHELRGLYAVVRHPRAVVSPSASVGDGTFVGAGAIVQGRARVGAHGIINTGAIIEHDCVLATNVHVAPGAVLGGQVSVGRDTLIGLGARVRPGVKIGAGCIVGVGAAVVRDVPDGIKVLGVPAKPSEWWTELDSA